MTPFLYNVADTYYKAYGQKISRYTFVFPNRRAGIFFQHYLSEIAKQPIFSPEILTVTDLFEKLCPLQKADRIEMLFMLYDIYKRVSASTETFDEFLYWGDMLLNDFDDVDKYLVDAKQLFRNVYDLKEIDSGFSYLNEDQIEAIRRFWSNFLPIGENEKKKDFFEMWEVLYELYSSLRNQLSEKGLAYEGMIFRHVAENIKEDMDIPFEKVVFVGLNGHSKSEKSFLRHLHKKGIADFYWDYSSPLVRDKENKASFFIDKNKTQFPSQLTLSPEEQTFDLPILEAIGVPSAVGQAKHVHSVIQSLIDEQKIASSDKALNTAVILPDENLLLPVLYSIPEEIDKINVTMGYNLSNSSISGLMEHIFDLQRNIRNTHGETGFYHRPVLAILNHRYITSLVGNTAKELRKEIVKYNRIIVDSNELTKHPLLKLIFKPVHEWHQIPNYLKEILSYLKITLSTRYTPDNEDEDLNIRSIDLEGEFIVEYYKTINKMEESLRNSKAVPNMSIETYLKLLKKLIIGISVPFSGEPLSGLQVMGVLETRALDFDNLIIMSMNEGIFPLKKAASSFIPYNLRRGFDLPTYEHQDSIYAYHFYRMINRAKRIFLLYDTRTEGLQSGEVSRYFNQIKHLYADRFDIHEKLAVYKVSTNDSLAISVKKTPAIMSKLETFTSGKGSSLSASTINTYINCPLQFYFAYVENMAEEDEIAETIEASTFGSIFHSVMEWLYKPFAGKMITADLIRNIAKDEKLLTETIERSFAENYFKTPDRVKKLTGQNFLTGEVLRKYIKQVLATDAKLTPFIYIQSEKRIVKDYPLPSGKEVSLKSFIDRVDEVKGHTRIIDYKTGKGVLRFRSMTELFDKEMKDRPKAVMQVFMYALLYDLDNPGKVIQPGIYYLRNLFDPKFEAGVIYRSDKADIPVADFATYKQEFKTMFDNCIEEIFDPAIPFSQTPTGEACKWCVFTNICKK